MVEGSNSRTTDTDHPSEEGHDVSQAVLPLDFDPDQPVPFRLTPRARRVVAPETLPSLSVVADTPAEREIPDVPADLDDPHDPRSARARALRRGGMSVARIADRLAVDELVVRTWTEDLAARGRRLRAVPASTARPVATPGDSEQRLAQRHRDFERDRARAVHEAAARLDDPGFVRGLALTVAAAEIDPHAVFVSLRDRAVARVVRQWLVQQAGADPRDLRVVLRLGTAQGADLVVHRWAEALDLPVDRLSRTRWPSAPSAEASQALLRVADPAVAARVAGWGDALLGEAAMAAASADQEF